MPSRIFFWDLVQLQRLVKCSSDGPKYLLLKIFFNICGVYHQVLLSLSRYFFTLVAYGLQRGQSLWGSGMVLMFLTRNTDVKSMIMLLSLNDLFSFLLAWFVWCPDFILKVWDQFQEVVVHQDLSVCYCSFFDEWDWCFLLIRIFICALNFLVLPYGAFIKHDRIKTVTMLFLFPPDI